MKLIDTFAREHLLGQVAELPTGNLVWVDAVNGNNDTGQRGRLDLPFKTLTEAKENAVAGDTIIVLPGTYNEKNLLKDGVNWHFLPGAKVEYGGTAQGAIFDTSSLGANGAVTSLISGYGEFRVTSEDTSCWIVSSAAAGSNIYIQCRSMTSDETGCIHFTDSSGVLKVEVMEAITAETQALYMSGAGGQVEVSATELCSGYGPVVESWAGSLLLKAEKTYGPGGVFITTAANNKVRIAVSEIGGDDIAVDISNFYSDSTVMLRGARIAGPYCAVCVEGEVNTTIIQCCTLIVDSSGLASLYIEADTTVQMYGVSAANMAMGGSGTIEGPGLVVDPDLI